jgi:lipoprotein-releasing system permease protein
MYKLLLCWRYLRTRYIALASIISVMLGVATMIVVNSVMSGFTTEMQDRIHGILSDVVFEANSLEGFPNAEWHMEQIEAAAGQWIEGMTATVVVPAMLSFQVREQWITRQIQLIGIDAENQGRVSDFAKYLQHPSNRESFAFKLHENGYDTFDHQSESGGFKRPQMATAGWEHRRQMTWDKAFRRSMREQETDTDPAQREDSTSGANSAVPFDPFSSAVAGPTDETQEFNASRDQHTGVVIGIALSSIRRSVGLDKNGEQEYEEQFLALPGDDVILAFPTVAMSATTPDVGIGRDHFTIVDLYESKMSEYDASFVFVPIEKLQQLRGMTDPTTGVGFVNSIQIKLKPGADGDLVRDLIREKFSAEFYSVSTWRDKQGALLAAVQMETAILNVLLFLIIAVAGFGILAIFFMIVVEKTRDIGILKSLGASAWGVMGIFLSYGLSLGVLGSGVGMVMGITFVHYINQIADLLGRITGRPIFDPEIYYFYKIPAIIDPFTVGWIVAGAVAIAVLASVLPACRAARLHPVEALRYE